MNRICFILLLLCASLVSPALPPLSAASAGSIPVAALQALLDNAVAQGVPGAVMGVATEEGAWFGSAGVADSGTFESMSPSHAIRIASVTKTFTASLIWSLIEEKRLRLNDTVDKWLSPGLVPKGDIITVGMLLNHTSGLFDHENAPEFMKKLLKDPTHEWTAEEVLAITRNHPVNFDPGESFSYCNTGYYILGLIAEAATGSTVADMVHKRFFTANGMTGTSLSESGALPRHRTPGYLWRDGYNHPLSTLRWNFSWDWTAGAGVSTAYDMLTWATALMGGSVLKPETLERAWTVTEPSLMGYGFEVTTNSMGYRRIGHTGLNPGTTTDFLFYPDKGWVLFTGLNMSDYRTRPQLHTERILLDIRHAAEGALGWNVDYRSTIKKTSKLIREQMRDNKVVGLGIALVDGHDVVWQQGFGYADRAGKISATADTIFQIGSISKPLTAIALMQLAEQGKVDIDRPLVDSMPDFDIKSRLPGVDAASVTPRLMMSHHAGLPYNAAQMLSYTFRPKLMEQVPALLHRNWLCFPPDITYSYSNMGAVLSGLLVERLTGQDFVSYTDRHVFAPMAMNLSSFAPKPAMKPYLSKSYGSDGKEQQTVYINYLPAGSALSSAAEMSNFMRTMLANGRFGANRLIQPATLQEMWTPQNLDVPLDFDYRFGLFWILTDPELKYAGEVREFSGDAAHQHSRMTLMPGRQLGVVVLTNSVNGGTVARTVSTAAIQNALLAKDGISPPTAPPLPPTTPVPPETLAACTGLYTGMGGGVVTLSVEDDHLLAKAFSGLSYRLVPLADGNFSVVGFAGMEDHELSFETVAGETVFADIWLGVKMLPFLTRVTLSAPRQAWIDRIGTYTVDMSSGFYPFWKTVQLLEQDGVLVMIVNGATYYALDTVSDTAAVNVGLGTYYGDTIRIERKGGIERLIFQNYPFRKAS